MGFKKVTKIVSLLFILENHSFNWDWSLLSEKIKDTNSDTIANFDLISLIIKVIYNKSDVISDEEDIYSILTNKMSLDYIKDDITKLKSIPWNKDILSKRLKDNENLEYFLINGKDLLNMDIISRNI